jgi:hypothetical protein
LKPLFGKKRLDAPRRKNFFESGPWALNTPTPMTQIHKSLFASFSSEKDVLACCRFNLK